MRGFEAALEDYTRAVAGSLIIAAKEDLDAASAERKEELKATIKSLEGVGAKIGTGKIFEAWNDVVTAQASLVTAVRADSMKASETQSVPAAFATDESVREGIAVGAINGLPVYRPFAKLVRAIRRGDRLADIAAVVIAAAVGVGVLWNASLSWGGPGDQLAAILWGLGVHQLSYNGLSSIFEKFTK
jgi:hypothetical protein